MSPVLIPGARVTSPDLDAAMDRVSARYAMFHAPLAVGAVILACLPLMDNTQTYAGSALKMIAGENGTGAAAGLLLTAVTVLLLTVMVLRAPRSSGPPAAAAGSAALVDMLLIFRPGTAPYPPDLSDAGVAAVALATCVVLVGVAHAVHLASVRARDARYRRDHRDRREWSGS